MNCSSDLPKKDAETERHLAKVEQGKLVEKRSAEFTSIMHFAALCVRG